MTDESEAARSRRAPAPPPRQNVRPPEPRPRTHVDNSLALLPAPPRLIRPSEHLAIVERAMERRHHLSESQRSHFSSERPIHDDRVERRPQSMSESMECRQEVRPQHLVPSVTVIQGPRPTLQAPAPPPPAHRSVAPPVHRSVGPLVHRSVAPPVPRSVAPPSLRTPVPAAPVTRIPQPRRDIQGSTNNFEDMPNTFKSYYFAASSDEEGDNRLHITKPKSLKRSDSNTNIHKFFDEPKTKKPKKGQSSTVGQTREGGMTLLSTNTNEWFIFGVVTEKSEEDEHVKPHITPCERHRTPKNHSSGYDQTHGPNQMKAVVKDIGDQRRIQVTVTKSNQNNCELCKNEKDIDKLN